MAALLNLLSSMGSNPVALKATLIGFEDLPTAVQTAINTRWKQTVHAFRTISDPTAIRNSVLIIMKSQNRNVVFFKAHVGEAATTTGGVAFDATPLTSQWYCHDPLYLAKKGLTEPRIEALLKTELRYVFGMTVRPVVSAQPSRWPQFQVSLNRFPSVSFTLILYDGRYPMLVSVIGDLVFQATHVFIQEGEGILATPSAYLIGYLALSDPASLNIVGGIPFTVSMTEECRKVLKLTK